jgi:hypothetical protein
MDLNLIFQFYSMCLIIFFSLGIYLLERKQPLFANFCIIIAFFILTGLSMMFDSLALECLCLTINTFLICRLLWDKWASKFIGIFMLIVEITKIKRLISDASVKKKK